MKKLLLVSLIFTIFSCQYDDTWIKEEFTELEERINNLEKLCNGLNSDIEAMEDIIEALKANEYISEVLPINEKGKEIGYKIIFESGREVCIYHGEDGKDGEKGQDGQDGKDGEKGQDGQDGKDGEDGKDGKDGYVPEIGVKQDNDGEWYWTIDGEWMRDDDGNRISTTGRNDLIPVLKIEDMYWYISYDGGMNWTRLAKAVGENGKSYFKEVTQDDDNVYITLADGNTISLPKTSSFALELNITGDIPCRPCDTLRIPYTLRGAGDNAEVITLSEGGWSAEAVSVSASEGYIEITAPEDISEGQVIVMASNQSKTIVKSLSFVAGVFNCDESFVIDSKGGTFTVNLSTNYEYEIEIKGSWIRHIETKATRSETLTFSYDALPSSMSTRETQISFIDKYSGSVKTIDICQGSIVSLDQQQLTMFIDDEVFLNTTIRGAHQDIVWTSSNSNVAWVSQEGKILGISKGTATITAMTSDYKHSAKCVVTVAKLSDYIYMEYGSATNLSYSNGYVNAGSKLSWYFYNNSSKDVLVKYLQIVDNSGTESNLMSVDETLSPGSYSGWAITLGRAYKAPKCKAIFKYNGKEYSIICGHMFN